MECHPFAILPLRLKLALSCCLARLLFLFTTLLIRLVLLPRACKHRVQGILEDMTVVVDQAFLVFGLVVLDYSNEAKIPEEH